MVLAICMDEFESPTERLLNSESSFPMIDQRITLHDGRTLSYDDYGDPAGVPVILFHGLGSSRRFHPPDEQTLIAQNIHLVVPDRPGIGGSSRTPAHNILGYAEDIATLDKVLQLGRFIALGWSAGAAYALACAYALPTHISMVGIVSGAAPFTGADAPHHLPNQWRRIGLMTHYAPWMIRRFFRQTSHKITTDADAALKKSIEEMDAPDRALMAQPAIYQMMRESSLEGFTNHGEGVADDALALARPWGFALNEIQQQVLLWYGSDDTTWPVQVGQHLADKLLHAELTVTDGAAHLLLLSHWQSILERLLERAAAFSPSYA